ncbi:unnamed protein product, partial [Polarella glacialis]
MPYNLTGPGRNALSLAGGTAMAMPLAEAPTSEISAGSLAILGGVMLLCCFASSLAVLLKFCGARICRRSTGKVEQAPADEDGKGEVKAAWCPQGHEELRRAGEDLLQDLQTMFGSQSPKNWGGVSTGFSPVLPATGPGALESQLDKVLQAWHARQVEACKDVDSITPKLLRMLADISQIVVEDSLELETPDPPISLARCCSTISLSRVRQVEDAWRELLHDLFGSQPQEQDPLPPPSEQLPPPLPEPVPQAPWWPNGFEDVGEAGTKLLDEVEQLVRSQSFTVCDLDGLLSLWKEAQFVAGEDAASITPSLLDKLAAVAKILIAAGVESANGELSMDAFGQLRENTEDAWRQLLEETLAREQQEQEEVEAPLPLSDQQPLPPCEPPPSSRPPWWPDGFEDLGRAGEKLLNDLEQLVKDSSESDKAGSSEQLPRLQRDVDNLLQDWQKEQATADENVESVTPSLLKKLADVAQILIPDCFEPGNGDVSMERFSQQRAGTEDAWRQLLKDTSAEEAQQQQQQWWPIGKEELGEAGEELLQELASLLESRRGRQRAVSGSKKIPSLNAELGDLLENWRKHKLMSAMDLDITDPVLRSLAGEAQDAVLSLKAKAAKAEGGNGEMTASAIEQLMPDIREAWRSRLAADQEQAAWALGDKHPDFQWWPDGQVEVQKVGQELMAELEKLFTSHTWRDPSLDAKGNKKLLQAELDSLLNGWQQRRLARGENVDDNTQSLIQGLAEGLKDAVQGQAGIAKDFAQFRPVLEQAWRKRLAEQAVEPEVQWWPEGQEELREAGEELLVELLELLESRRGTIEAGGKKLLNLNAELGDLLDNWRQRNCLDITDPVLRSLAGEAQDAVLSLKAKAAKADGGNDEALDIQDIRRAWRQRLAAAQNESAWAMGDAAVAFQKAGQDLMVELEQLFTSHTWRDPSLDAKGNKKSLRAELDSMLNGWQQRQLADGENVVDDVTASFMRGMADGVKEAVRSHKGIPQDFKEFRPVLEEAWRKRLAEQATPASEPEVQWWPEGQVEVQKAGQELLVQLEQVFTSRTWHDPGLDSKCNKKLLKAALDSLLNGWQQCQLADGENVDDVTASLMRGMADNVKEAVQSHKGIPQDFKEFRPVLEEAWRKRLAEQATPASEPEVQWWPEGQVEVQKAGQELLVQLEQVFTSRTWHDPGLDSKGNKKLLKAELDSLLNGWQQRQLADGENVDDVTASLMRGMANNVKEAVQSHKGIPQDFKGFRPVLEEAWRKRLAEQATPASEPEVQWWPEGQVEVQKAGQELLVQLEQVFTSRTWHDPGLDSKGNKKLLKAELDSLLNGWQQRQLADGENVDDVTASLMRGMADNVKEAVQSHKGIPQDFKEFRPVLEEAWRKRLAEQATPASEPEVQWWPEGQVEVQKAGQELLAQLEQVFTSRTWHDPGLDSKGNKKLLKDELDSLLNGWQQRQLADGENVDDVTASLMRGMADNVKEAVQSHKGIPQDFKEFRPVLEEAWRKRLAEQATPASEPEVQWWPEGQVEVQKAGQELLVQLEQVFTSRTWHDPGLDSKGNKKLLKAELDSLLSGWQQRQLADGENVDDATADLIRGMADSFKSVMRSHNGIPKDFKELRPVLEEAWRKRLAEQATQAVTAREPQPEVQWWPEGQVELQKAGQDLLADLEHLFVSRTWQDASLAAKGNKQFLEVQLDSVILGWQQRRMATGGEDFDCITASLLLAETAKDEVLGQQGIPKDFKELRPVLEEAWRKRL